MLVREWLNQATQRLTEAGISSSRLDAELILAHCMNISRSHLLAQQHNTLLDTEITQAQMLLGRRIVREPLAYIFGQTEFFGLNLHVNPCVLIPRPESEALVEAAISHSPTGVRLHDVGTGSGALALAIKKHRPDLVVSASDISPDALQTARRNASKLKLDISLSKTDLLTGVKAEVIIANLPYVDTQQERSPETQYEPAMALFAENHGLALYEKLFNQIPSCCKLVIVECEPQQRHSISEYAKNQHFMHDEIAPFISLYRRS